MPIAYNLYRQYILLGISTVTQPIVPYLGLADCDMTKTGGSPWEACCCNSISLCIPCCGISGQFALKEGLHSALHTNDVVQERASYNVYVYLTFNCGDGLQISTAWETSLQKLSAHKTLDMYLPVFWVALHGKGSDSNPLALANSLAA